MDQNIPNSVRRPAKALKTDSLKWWVFLLSQEIAGAGKELVEKTLISFVIGASIAMVAIPLLDLATWADVLHHWMHQSVPDIEIFRDYRNYK